MKGRIQTNGVKFISNQKISTHRQDDDSPADLHKLKHVSEILVCEGNDSIRQYIEWLGLSRDPKILVLSSIHHYYYDAEEMQNIHTVVNLKELNHIKEISNFLQSMFLILPPKCYLIGCFIDNKRQSGFSFRKRPEDINPAQQKLETLNGIVSSVPILNTIFNILDAKPNKYLSVKNVTLLLRNNGFKVIDMTELSGMTYFCSQSERNAYN
jgi:hypothetical protein